MACLMPTRSSRSDLGTVHGRVVDGQGRPLGEAVVMIVGDSPTHPDIAALTNEKGEYSYTSLLPGTYTLLVNVLDQEPQQGSVDVLAGAVARLDFVFP